MMLPAQAQAAEERFRAWYAQRGWSPFDFQEEMLAQMLAGRSGLLNAPTGSGKTFALWLPILAADFARKGEASFEPGQGLQALWITPLRALSQDIAQACQQACEGWGLPWRVECRNGDTAPSVKERQRRQMPEGLVTTPESLHVLIAGRQHADRFRSLRVVVIDEWHELLGSKRGVQVELALAHLRALVPGLQVWGISATIGNLAQSLEVLLHPAQGEGVIVRSKLGKRIEVESLLPETVERFPWAGHLGIRMAKQVLEKIAASRSALIFTNTRAQAEIWYQTLLQEQPELAGLLAMHHGSLSQELRAWVEEALHQGSLKAVVCTSSLDLGVDFRPVDTVIQIGGPKGIARFLQRAGRSGHGPGELSRIFFVPTHSLELIEAAALRQAVEQGIIEERRPLEQPLDVLIQYLLTLAVGDGFHPAQAWAEARNTYAYRELDEADFRWALDFIRTGGSSLAAYDEYRKVEVDEAGVYRITDRAIARRHRLSIGAIVSETSLTVKFASGGRLGTVEESFISQLSPGDTFWFGGRCLELLRVRNLEVQVRKSSANKGAVPRWMGSRMQLSSQMSALLRAQLDDYLRQDFRSPETELLRPLFDLQSQLSALPSPRQCLIEAIRSREGHHVFVYPFEGRVVHEVLAALCAWRMAQIRPISFSIAMNDYGFELLSDQEPPLAEALEAGLFSTWQLGPDLQRSINETEMTQRRFREIAAIAGLLFKGFPGKAVSSKHLQASAALLYRVFREYDPGNLLLAQAYREVLDLQVDEERLRSVLERLGGQAQLLTRPPRFTPFCFPIMVDRLRERLSSEKLEDRVRRLTQQLEKA
jgi:ATP-dependent Lhr-like helicase